MEVLLTVYSDEKEYFSREVSLPCVIGRGKQCDVTIVHPLVSRRHCEIYEEDGVVMARDLGSLNGTFFRGARIGRGVAIPSGSCISIGRLALRIGKETETSETTAPEDDVELLDDLISDRSKEDQSGDTGSSVIDLDAYLSGS